MLFLASFILKGQSQAALVAATMAVLGLIIPPAAWISAAAIVLITLVQGPKRGMITTASAFLGAAIFSYLIFATPQIAVMFVLLAWLPAWIVSVVLRETVSLAYALQVVTAMGLFAVLMLYGLYPDFGEFWREALDHMIAELVQQSNEFSVTELKQTQDWIIKFLPGMFVVGIMFGTMISLFLGRWWQAVNFNSGGFGKEFRALNLGKISALIASVIFVIAMILNSVVVIALLTVVFVLYGMQALSLLHAVIKIRKLNTTWLFVVYMVMLFIPQVSMLLILISFVDPWLDVRSRLSQTI